MQRGTSVVPKTVQVARMIENMSLFTLRDEDLEKINRISEETGSVRFLDPRNHIGFDIFDEESDEPVVERS